MHVLNSSARRGRLAQILQKRSLSYPGACMKTALLHEVDGLRTIALVLEQGEEAAATLVSFAVEHRLGTSHFTAIGAFSRAVVAYFDWSTKRYHHVAIDEQVEVLSLVGDIVIERERPNVHAHVVLGKADASAHGGHLVEGHVRPTLEVIVTETPRHLRRRFDPDSELALIDPSAR
jgi:predicted DNA-binding protein with PD1-like motif